MFLRIKRYAVIALSVVGSATLLFSCGKKTQITEYDNETLMTESSENRTITMMENGKRSYTFTSPLMEGYRLAANPYQEFRRGIEMTTYTDSLSLPEVTITANYAIYYERQKLWEAKGNVLVIRRDREEGDTTVTGLTEVYTQQLFWNATTNKIYSNVDTKVLQGDGWHFGVGFDADDDLKNIHFRRYSSEIEFDMSEPEKSDTTERKSIDQRIKDNKSASEQENKTDKTGKATRSERGGKSQIASKQSPTFSAPESSDDNIVRPAVPANSFDKMQIEAKQRTRPMGSERELRPEGKSMHTPTKQKALGDKPSKALVDREVQIAPSKR